jgi:hypothetical protein
MVGFVVEKRASVRDVRYTADELGTSVSCSPLGLLSFTELATLRRDVPVRSGPSYALVALARSLCLCLRSFTYDCEFWVARRPANVPAEHLQSQSEAKKDA